MAGLVPAIHVFVAKKQDVDARHKAGHDDLIIQQASPPPHRAFDLAVRLVGRQEHVVVVIEAEG
jgi:hypothetical protein